MKCNVGGADRTFRMATGTALAAGALLAPMSASSRLALLVPAGVAFFTAMTRYCPLNDAIGLNTCEPDTLRVTASPMAARVGG